MSGATQPGPVTANAPHSWSVATTAGSVVSAFIASTCCIGPLVFALLGIGGAGLLVKLEPWRPYFVGLTFLLLGAGFYFAYRRPARAATDGPACDCPAPRANRAGRVMLWVVTPVVAGFLVFPYVAAWIWG